MLHIAIVIALLTPAQAPSQNARGRDNRTWYQAYADGVRAFQASNWQAAIDSFEAAKRANRAPRPGRRIPFYGDVFDDYLPDYYLGIAYLNVKRFAEANRAFEAVRTSGVVGPRDREYAQFDKGAKEARDAVQLAQVTSPPPPPPPGPTATQNTAAQTAAANPPPGVVPTTTPNAAAPNSAVNNNSPVQQAPLAAVTPAPANPVLPSAGSENAVRPTQATVNNPVTNPVRPNPTARPPLNAAVTSAVARPITAAEERAAIAEYLSGQYEQTARRLAAAAGGSASPRATFYLACSQAALVLVGQIDGSSLADARALMAKAGDASQFTADRRYISPRVLQMLEGKP